MRRAVWTVGLAAGLLALAATAWAQDPSGAAKAPRAPRVTHAPRPAADKDMDQGDPGMAMPGRGAGGPGMCRCGGPGMGMGRAGMGRGGMGRGHMGRFGTGRRAGGGGWMGGGRMGAGMGPGARMMARLDLTQSQRDRLADIHERAMKQSLQTRADLGVARIDLGTLLRADHPDREAIAAQIDRIAELRATMAKARMNALLDARGVLTPEQLKKARELHGGRGMGPHAGLDPGGPGGLGDMADPGDFDGPGPGDVPDAGIR